MSSFDCREQSMSSVGFCVINSAKRGYPLEDATHIALRKLCWRCGTYLNLEILKAVLFITK